jgi:hypothetical protein
MRLRSRKNRLPGGNVLSRLHKQLLAIARIINTRAQAASLSLRPHPRTILALITPSQPSRAPRCLMMPMADEYSENAGNVANCLPDAYPNRRHGNGAVQAIASVAKHRSGKRTAW